jgi:hypothetical protein
MKPQQQKKNRPIHKKNLNHQDTNARLFIKMDLKLPWQFSQPQQASAQATRR